MKSVRYCDEYTVDNWFHRTESGLTEVPSDIPRGAKVVRLDYNQRTRLFINTFSHLYKCERLDLDNNKISEIEAGAFNGLHKVKFFNLHENILSRLVPKAFNGLDYPKELHLSQNQFTRLAPNMFTSTRRCENLFLWGKKISSIDIGAFHGLRHLNTLTLNHNLLTVLRSKVFEHVPRPLRLALGDSSTDDTKNS